MKLHRRRLRLDGRAYTAITLRPGSYARFSTNHYHQTWHVLSDWHGARLLSRLLWGLAYQRMPGTFVLIDRPFLTPNPFDAATSDPIVLLPSVLTTLPATAARALRSALPLSGPSDATVRWHTPGLDAAVAADSAWQATPPGSRRWPAWQPDPHPRPWVDRIGGLIVIAAPPATLRGHALNIHRLGEYANRGMDYTALTWPLGEVQIFADYRHRVRAAVAARGEVLAEHSEPTPPDELNPKIWERGSAIRDRQLSQLPRAGAPQALPTGPATG
ncbi:hypothetical protein [Parafrankia sp. FMc2]|uniref:hypothetical protein n=1 Tax=Parafrankia sp. FMc2 TaxID=3233196 RepID=UPI0034D40BA4